MSKDECSEISLLFAVKTGPLAQGGFKGAIRAT